LEVTDSLCYGYHSGIEFGHQAGDISMDWVDEDGIGVVGDMLSVSGVRFWKKLREYISNHIRPSAIRVSVDQSTPLLVWTEPLLIKDLSNL
jgi:hypothetical protein